MTEEKNTGAPEQEMDLSEQRLIRRAKLKELQENGKDPFTITKYDVTHHSQEIKDFITNKYKGAVVPAF